MKITHLFVAFGFASEGPVGKDVTLAHREASNDEWKNNSEKQSQSSNERD